MIDVNPIVEKLLKSIDGVKVTFYYPSSFNTLPVISYYDISDIEGLRADNKEWTQDVDVQIDVWGKTAKQAKDISISVNDAMQSDGWRRTFSQPLPQDGEIYHRTMRFNKIFYLGGN